MRTLFSAKIVTENYLPVAEIHQLIVDVFNINFLPEDGEVPV